MEQNIYHQLQIGVEAGKLMLSMPPRLSMPPELDMGSIDIPIKEILQDSLEELLLTESYSSMSTRSSPNGTVTVKCHIQREVHVIRSSNRLTIEVTQTEKKKTQIELRNYSLQKLAGEKDNVRGVLCATAETDCNSGGNLGSRHVSVAGSHRGASGSDTDSDDDSDEKESCNSESDSASELSDNSDLVDLKSECECDCDYCKSK